MPDPSLSPLRSLTRLGDRRACLCDARLASTCTCVDVTPPLCCTLLCLSGRLRDSRSSCALQVLSVAAPALGWSRIRTEVFGRSIFNIQAIALQWAKGGMAARHADAYLVPKPEWRALARRWRLGSSGTSRHELLENKPAWMHHSGVKPLQRASTITRLTAGWSEVRSHNEDDVEEPSAAPEAAAGEGHEHTRQPGLANPNERTSESARRSEPQGREEEYDEEVACATAAQVAATSTLTSVEPDVPVAVHAAAMAGGAAAEATFVRAEPMHMLVQRNAAAATPFLIGAVPEPDEMIEATRSFRAQSAAETPRPRSAHEIAPESAAADAETERAEDAEGSSSPPRAAAYQPPPVASSAERRRERRPAPSPGDGDLVSHRSAPPHRSGRNQGPRPFSGVDQGPRPFTAPTYTTWQPSVPTSSPVRRSISTTLATTPTTRSVYTRPVHSAPYALRYHQHVSSHPHQHDPTRYQLGATFEFKQLFEEKAELADVHVDMGPPAHDIEPHLFDGRRLNAGQLEEDLRR